MASGKSDPICSVGETDWDPVMVAHTRALCLPSAVTEHFPGEEIPESLPEEGGGRDIVEEKAEGYTPGAVAGSRPLFGGNRYRHRSF